MEILILGKKNQITNYEHEYLNSHYLLWTHRKKYTDIHSSSTKQFKYF